MSGTPGASGSASLAAAEKTIRGRHGVRLCMSRAEPRPSRLLSPGLGRVQAGEGSKETLRPQEGGEVVRSWGRRHAGNPWLTMTLALVQDINLPKILEVTTQ